jgi:hypothetical protein
MAAVVFSTRADSIDVWGKHRVQVGLATFSATTYTVGGYTLTPANYNMRQIYGIDVIGSDTNGATYLAAYNTQTGKFQLYTAVGVEQTAASTNGVFTFIVIGE